MPFCRNCGQEVNENAYICIHCGVLIQNIPVKNEGQPNDGTTLGIIGLCFALFIPLVTWIVSAIGFSQAERSDNKSAKTMNLIALCVTSVMALFYAILSIF